MNSFRRLWTVLFRWRPSTCRTRLKSCRTRAASPLPSIRDCDDRGGCAGFPPRDPFSREGVALPRYSIDAARHATDGEPLYDLQEATNEKDSRNRHRSSHPRRGYRLRERAQDEGGINPPAPTIKVYPPQIIEHKGTAFGRDYPKWMDAALDGPKAVEKMPDFANKYVVIVQEDGKDLDRGPACGLEARRSGHDRGDDLHPRQGYLRRCPGRRQG